jgi:hypothetical protein
MTFSTKVSLDPAWIDLARVLKGIAERHAAELQQGPPTDPAPEPRCEDGAKSNTPVLPGDGADLELATSLPTVEARPNHAARRSQIGPGAQPRPSSRTVQPKMRPAAEPPRVGSAAPLLRWDAS